MDNMTGEEFRDLYTRATGHGWRKEGAWWLAYCPCHADGTKHNFKGGESLGCSVARGVIKCYAGCDFKEIVRVVREAAGAPVQSLQANGTPRGAVTRRREGSMVALYEFVDFETGAVVGEKGRFEYEDGSKSFLWRQPGTEGWPRESGIEMHTMPLFSCRNPLPPAPEPIWFVEGEKACAACWEHGLPTVTNGGGAGQKEFGSSLDVLKGRLVRLWPDNDAAGAAFMALIRAKLVALGCSVEVVSVSLPPKGDAADYFKAGGLVEGITSADPTKPIVSILGEDRVKVVAPTESGPVAFDFADMEKHRKDFACELTITMPSDPEPYTERLNLNSNSALTQLRRDLEAVYGKGGIEWTRLLNRVTGLAREAYLNQERGVDVWDIAEHVGEVLMVGQLLVRDGVTIFFGDGGSLKSYITSSIALCMALGIDFVDFPTPQLTPMVIDYEDSDTNFKRRLERIALGIDPTLAGAVMGVKYWSARGIPLIDQVDAVKRYVEKHGVGFIIIDSAAPACGGDPNDHESVMQLFRAIHQIGLPCAIIAHVTKQLENTKPFGSAFWHNEARRTWFVSRVTEEDSDDVDLAVYNRKVNDGRVPHPIAFRFHFSESLTGPVSIGLQDMEGAPQQLLSLTSVRNQLWAALSGAPRTIKELGEELGIPQKAVDSALRRGPFATAGTRNADGVGGRPQVVWARLSTAIPPEGKPPEELKENPGPKPWFPDS